MATNFAGGALRRSENAIRQAYAEQLAEQERQRQRELNKNTGGLVGGIGYLLEKNLTGFMSSVEGIWDFTAGGLAKLFGGDDWAESQIKNDWFGDWYSHPDEWYNPGKGWTVAGDVSQGIGTSGPGIVAAVVGGIITAGSGGTASAVGVPLIAAGVSALGAAGTSTKEAYQKTGELTGKEFGYGALSGATEGVIEGVSNIAGFGSGAVVKGVTSGVAKGTAKGAAKSAAKTVAKTVAKNSLGKELLKGFAGEALEEGISEFLSPFWERATYDPDAEMASVQEIAYASLIGGLSGMVMEGGNVAIDSSASFFRGNAANKNGKTDAVTGLSRIISEFATTNNIEEEAFTNVRDTYNKFTESLKATNGQVQTVGQKKLLGDLQRENTIAVFQPMMVKSAVNTIVNADAISARLADMGIKNADGTAITADQLRAGIDLNNRKSVSKGLKTNNELRAVVAMDVAGRLMMDARQMSDAVARGKAIASRADLANFNTTATPEEKLGVATMLGVGVDELASMDSDTLNARIVEAFENGRIDQYTKQQEVIRAVEAIPESKARPIPSTAFTMTADGIRRYTDGISRVALIKEGDVYRIYDYDSRTMSRDMSRAEANAALMEYKNRQSFETASVNDNIMSLIDNVERGTFKDNDTVELKKLPPNVAKRVQAITGIDVTNFKVAIEARQLAHIMKDHGKEGKTDQSMKIDSDIAKMEFAMQDPDSISPAGKTQAYSYMRDGRNRTADTVIYEKDIGSKSYYVVQAVADTKKKTLFIVGAFIGEKGYKKGTSQLIDTASSPNATPDNGSVVVPDYSIPQDSEKVNTPDEKNISKPKKTELSREDLDTLAKENITVYSKLSVPNRAMVRNVLNNALANGFSQSEAVVLAEVSARSGVDVLISKKLCAVARERGTTKLIYADGFYDPVDNRIVINPEGDRSVDALLIHELTHAIYKDREGRYILERGVKNMSDAEKEAIINRYKKAGKKTTVELADELNAHYIEGQLGNKNLLGKLVADSPTLADKVLAFFKGASNDYADNAELSASAKRLFKRYKKLFDTFSEQNQGANAYAAPVADIEAARAKGDTRFSLQFASDIADNQRKFILDNEGKVALSMEELNAAVEQTAAMVNIMSKYKNILPEDKVGKTLVKNGSYDVSVENTTICIRTLAYNSFVDMVSEKIGRPLTQMESFLVSQKLYDIAKEPQCLYCYVSLDRKAYNDMLVRYVEQRDAAIEAYKDAGKPVVSESSELYKSFLNGRKPTTNMWLRYKSWIDSYNKGEHLLTLDEISTEDRRSALYNSKDSVIKSQISDMLKYAQSGSWAKKQTQYVAYYDDILKLSDKVVRDLNKHYGLRWYSFSDYSGAFIVENMQQITDASIRGLKGLAYTKDTDFVKIFAPTGMNINVSVYATKDGKGGYVIDEKQSANIKEAIDLRKKYPNVGIVVVATDEKGVEWALEQEWSDVVIPFHTVRTGAQVAEFYDWTVFNEEQNDSVSDSNMWDAYVESIASGKSDKVKKKISKMVYPSEHQNNKDTYLKLIKERGLKPRFSSFLDNPNYMKLVNETRQSEAETSVLKPNFSLAAAKSAFNKFVESGGYYEGWYNDGIDVDGEAEIVASDIRAGKKANEVSYGRQDLNYSDVQKRRKALREHGRRLALPKGDADYLSAVERGDMEAAQKMVDEAAKKTVYNSPLLYHGTNRFGFTEFDTNRGHGFIYGTTKSVVAANYGGRDNYAFIRKIGKKYISPDSTEYWLDPTKAIIQNAESVLGTKYKVLDDATRQNLRKDVFKQAEIVANKLDELYADLNLPSDIENDLSWVTDVFYTIRENDSEFFSDDTDYKNQWVSSLQNSVNHYNESYPNLRGYLGEHLNEFDDNGKKFARFLMSYELTDTAIDIEYKYLRAANPTNEVQYLNAETNQNIVTREQLQDIIDNVKNIGVYSLYGDVGNNPLVVDADGRDWVLLKVPEMGDDKYHSTDVVAEWAKDKGYTSVIVKNVYDGGEKADDYIFFDSNQVKSADPVTYDDNGNVIPLSERFNPKNKDIRYALPKDIDIESNLDYTEKQYNDFGWARGNGILSKTENARLRSLFADAVSKQGSPYRTKSGEYMIAVGDIADNKIVYMKGTIDNPVITRILEIDLYDETELEQKRRNVYEIERRGIQRKTSGIFRRHNPFDIGYRQWSEQRKGAKGESNNIRLGADRRTGTGKAEATSKRITPYLPVVRTFTDVSGRNRNVIRVDGKFMIEGNHRAGYSPSIEEAVSSENKRVIDRYARKYNTTAGIVRKKLASDPDFLKSEWKRGKRFALPEGAEIESVSDASPAERRISDIYSKLMDGKRKIDGYSIYVYRDTANDGATITFKTDSGEKISNRVELGRYMSNEQLFTYAAGYIAEYEGLTPSSDNGNIKKLLADATEEARNNFMSEFNAKLDRLAVLEAERSELTKQFKGERFGQNPNVPASKETLNKVHEYDQQITKLTKSILQMEDEAKVLPTFVSNLRKDIQSRNRLESLIAAKAMRMKDLKIGRFSNATQAESDTFKSTIYKLASIQYRGVFNQSGTRGVIRDLNAWYTSNNPVLDISGDPESSLYVPHVKAMLESLSTGKSKQFTMSELSDLYDVMSYFVKFVENYSRVYMNGNFVEALPLAEQFIDVINENAELKGNKSASVAKIKLKGLADSYTDTFLEPEALVKLRDLYNENGFNTTMFNMLREATMNSKIKEMEVLAPYDKFLTDHKKYIENASVETVEYLGHNVPRIQLIDLYMSYGREQAQRGLLESGIAFTALDGNTEHIRGILDSNQEYTDEQIKKTAEKERAKIKKLLSDTDLEYADILENIYNVEAKSLKMDMDMKLYGFTNAVEGFYYPIRRYGAGTNSIDTDYKSELDHVSNAGFNKDTVQGAKQKLIIESADNRMRRHVSAVCNYAYLSPAIKAYDKLFNLDISGNANNPISVRTRTENIWKSGQEYFRKMLSDTQGIPSGDKTGQKVLGAIRGGYAKAVLGANPKVLATQLSSLFASLSMLDADTVTKAAVGISAKDVEQYCPLAKLRAYENTAALAQAVIDREGRAVSKAGKIGKGVEKVSDTLMKPIGMVDSFVVRCLFAACQLQVEKNGGAKFGTEANKVEAGKLLTKVILETQQNAFATERSAAMRSSSEFMRTITMFTSDAIKVVGRVIDGFGEVSVLKAKINALGTDAKSQAKKAQLETSLKAANKKLGKSIAALVSSSLYMALIGRLFFKLFGKEYDEDESWVSAFVLDSIGNLIGGLPIASDIYSFFVDGFGVESFTYSSINDLLESASSVIDTTGKVITGDATSQDVSRAAKGLILSISQITGLPVNNIYKQFYGTTKLISPETAYHVDEFFYAKNYTNDFYKAIENGDDQMAAHILSLTLGERIGGDFSAGVLDELMAVSKGGEKVLPREIPNEISIDGNKTAITPEDAEKMQSISAQSDGALNKLFTKADYKKLNNADKATAINYVYELYFEKAVADVLGTQRASAVTYLDAVGADTMALLYLATRGIESDKDKDGNSIAGSKRAKTIAAITAMNITKAEKVLLIYAKGYSYKDGDVSGMTETDAKKLLLKYILSLKVTSAKKAEIAALCGFTVKNGRILNDFK